MSKIVDDLQTTPTSVGHHHRSMERLSTDDVVRWHIIYNTSWQHTRVCIRMCPILSHVCITREQRIPLYLTRVPGLRTQNFLMSPIPQTHACDCAARQFWERSCDPLTPKVWLNNPTHPGPFGGWIFEHIRQEKHVRMHGV